MKTQDHDAHRFAVNTANAILNEVDRRQGMPAVSASAARDRDFYAREIAADLGSSSGRVKWAHDVASTTPPMPSEYDFDEYARSVGIDPGDRSEAMKSWEREWVGTASDLKARALRLIEATPGAVVKTSPAAVLGFE